MRKVSHCPSVEHINPNQPLMVSDDIDLENAFHFWQGASGDRYIHSVYSLYSCPEVPKANFVLVKRATNGDCTALMIGQTKDKAQSLNLAFLRENAAKLGANEIHIHVMTTSEAERNLVRLDLLGLQEVNGQTPSPRSNVHMM